MSNETLSKERRILRVLRKVLGNIVKDTAPRPGRPNPLQESTIEDIRGLFALIAERERELANEAGMTTKERPYFSDEPQSAHPLRLHKPAKKLDWAAPRETVASGWRARRLVRSDRDITSS